uniref:Uncharacterized protein n=1 Tax=Eutreptiella gymnastica TaxID=73025 RepID=A0A7S4CWU2_9EUGL
MLVIVKGHDWTPLAPAVCSRRLPRLDGVPDLAAHLEGHCFSSGYCVVPVHSCRFGVKGDDGTHDIFRCRGRGAVPQGLFGYCTVWQVSNAMSRESQHKSTTVLNHHLSAS